MLIHFLTNDVLNCQEKVQFFIRFQVYFGILILYKLQAFLTNIHFHPIRYKQESWNWRVKMAKIYSILNLQLFNLARLHLYFSSAVKSTIFVPKRMKGGL
jgi:hypothetical protein